MEEKIINYLGLELIPIRELKEKKDIKDFKYNLVTNNLFKFENYNHKEFYNLVEKIDKKLKNIDIFKINNTGILNSLVLIPTNYNFMFYIENNEELEFIKNINFILDKNIEENNLKNDYLIIYKKISFLSEEVKIDFKNKKIKFYLDNYKFLETDYTSNIKLNKIIKGIKNIYEFEKEKFIKIKINELKKEL
jgi:hypothetical protein